MLQRAICWWFHQKNREIAIGYLNVRVTKRCIKRSIKRTFCTIVLRPMHYNCKELICSDWNGKKEHERSWVHRFRFVISFPGVSLYIRQWPMMDQEATNIVHFCPIPLNLLEAHFFRRLLRFKKVLCPWSAKTCVTQKYGTRGCPTVFAALNIWFSHFIISSKLLHLKYKFITVR